MVAAAALSCAWALLLLTPRTFLTVGYGPDPLWRPAMGLFCLLAFVPAPSTFATSRPLWRWAPICLVVVPFVSPAIATAAVLTALAGGLCWVARPFAEALRNRLAAFAAVLLAGAFASNVYAHLDERLGAIPGLATILSLGLRLLGVSSHRWGDYVVAHLYGDNVPILPSLDKFGGEFLVVLLVSAVVAGFAFGFGLKSVLRAVGVILAVAVVHAAALMASIAGISPTDWWEESLLAAAFSPVLFLVPFVLGSRSAESEPTRPVFKTAPRFLAAAFGIFLLGLGWSWVDPGVPKRGDVVMDEGHCDWEQSNVPIDTEWYGSKTVYNYYNFAEALGHYFHSVTINRKPLDSGVLDGASVLILKTPTSPYTDSERRAIWNFVSRGGGLWLIGDHTDAFGMDTYLNSVAERYGMSFRKDASLEPTFSRNLYKPGAFSHPTIRNLPLFLFYTGDSLQAPLLQCDTIQTPRMFLDNPDYSAGTFFGNLKATVDKKFGNVAAALQAPAGRGRVALWSDSTLYSNFSIFVPGKMEVGLATIDWLNRTNGPVDVRLLLLGLGTTLTLLGLLSWRSGSWVFASVLALGGLPLALEMLQQRAFPLPKPHSPFDTVAFYEPEPTLHLPITSTIDQASDSGYLTSYVAVQRVGRRPSVAKTVAEAGASRTMVYVPDGSDRSAVECAKLLDFARSGGVLLVLDGGQAPVSTVRRLVEALGGQATPVPVVGEQTTVRPIAKDGVVDSTGHACGDNFYAYRLQGGAPVLRAAASKDVVGAEYKIGKGLVVVTSTTSLFSDSGVSFVQGIPNDAQLEVLKHLYDWYRR